MCKRLRKSRTSEHRLSRFIKGRAFDYYCQAYYFFSSRKSKGDYAEESFCITPLLNSYGSRRRSESRNAIIAAAGDALYAQPRRQLDGQIRGPLCRFLSI